MKSKQLVFTKPYVTEIIESDILPPHAGQVQVKLAFSTISSGTERANLVDDQKVSACLLYTSVKELGKLTP